MHDFYQLGTMPLVEMFQEVKKALADETKVADEQQNLVRARQYYKNNRNVVVPELFPIDQPRDLHAGHSGRENHQCL